MNTTVSTDRLTNALNLLQYGLATLNVVKLSLDNEGCDDMYIDSLHGAAVLLRDVESRLKEIVERPVIEE